MAAEPDDVLLVELYTPNYGALVALLAASQSAPGFRHPAAARTLTLRRHLDASGCGAVTVSAGLVATGPRADSASLLDAVSPSFSRKTVFLVRHGQSRWNEAQRNRRLDALVAFDHPLTRLGAEQALRLREQWRTECAADVTAAALAQAGPPAAAG